MQALATASVTIHAHALWFHAMHFLRFDFSINTWPDLFVMVQSMQNLGQATVGLL